MHDLFCRTHHYLVIVQQVRLNEMDEVVEPTKSLIEYSLEELKKSTSMYSPPPLPVGKRQLRSVLYIAANVSSLGGSFPVGDGRNYGGYTNHELQPNISYRVAVAVLITHLQV